MSRSLFDGHMVVFMMVSLSEAIRTDWWAGMAMAEIVGFRGQTAPTTKLESQTAFTDVVDSERTWEWLGSSHPAVHFGFGFEQGWS